MPRGRKVTPEEVAEWGKALDEGLAFKHVAEVFGVNKDTVAKYLPGRGWTKKQAIEHSHEVKRFNRTKLSLVG